MHGRNNCLSTYCHITDAKDSLNCNAIRTALSLVAPIDGTVNGWGLKLIRRWSVASAYNRACHICCGD